MYEGSLIFSQLMAHLPQHTFRRCVKRYQGDRYAKGFFCLDQYRCMAFAQLTYRASLRDIEVCLRAQQGKLYHMGIRSKISRSTLADANERRDWRIYADFAQSLIREARRLYVDEDLGFELEETAYALDATTIDLCLSVFPWARFRENKAAVKLHTLLDLRGSIPSFIHVTDGKVYDLSVFDVLVPEAGSIYVMDRGYHDFRMLYSLNQAAAYFVIRARKDLITKRIYSNPVDKSTGVRCDQIVRASSIGSRRNYPDKFRRVKYHDVETGKTLVFFTNNFILPALTVAELYRYRWQVELFFRWIKQHLRIKSFFGTSENAVKTQVWTAVSTYLLVAIIRKRLGIEANLYTILQVLSLTVFEKVPLDQLFRSCDYNFPVKHQCKQLNLFD
ncbi:MAG: IS4 family transposase [bacterium]|nr:IS4 family transposase [bacterium]